MFIKVKGFNDEKFGIIKKANSSSSCPKHELFSDMLLWLRTTATDPCNETRPLEKVRKRQLLKTREVLFLSSTEMPWKKRKLSQLQERSSIASVAALKKPNERSCFASSDSCLTSCIGTNESSEHILHNPPSSAWPLNSHENLSRKRIRNDPNDHSFECNDSISYSHSPTNPEKPEFQALRLSTQLLKSSNNVPLKQVRMFPANKNISLVIDSDNDSVDRSNESSPEEPRLPKFLDDYPRPAIPVGPRFQADFPDWTGQPTRERFSNARCNSTEDSKRLGTKIWPTEDKNSNNCHKGVGRGRPHSCSCKSSGSMECIKWHIVEKKCQLQYDLGPIFFSWKFDEMGEEASKSWTVKEQESFNILVSKSNSFLKPALKQFSRKNRESIVSYYFNVYILRLVSKQTRLVYHNAEDDSDDEEAIDVISMSTHKKTNYLMGGH